ncbi:DNRLRE domain-containing protein [Clostridium sporogenes]|uniref:DNRLRE domain-containing protein n=1 Tax=Clostridium botulinum TaxID=1491 RepID=A0A6M0T0W9_CLOBO|nr:DNRLRE domain-containing protein [Clostridium sporogenes]NFA59801.1 DNRLRE domain-containing protein [Clostridium botulinum]NFI72153.1 DNRLRE domain-containing protein [Clostridium sporogenes]NFL72574.1 DNRLRE domain-containing protein [Clostridium sporogenes]NFM23691.1 DNRLRE domain-containing protein [Clostridium sporogenes]NFP60999.1 DNRLRE domain-containing protein [Clostridium sporogenes]
MSFVGNVEKIPQADLYVAKLYPDTNFNGNDLLGCGRYYTENNIYRTLMYFDISSLPSNIFIDEAILKLYVKINIVDNITKPITIHNLLESFDKNTVTYSNQPSFEDNPYETLNINAEIDQFVEVDITDLLIEWYNSPTLNYGMLMKGLETEASFVGFSSTFDNDGTKFPNLEIYYGYYEGLSEYPSETVELLASDDSVNSSAIPLGPNIGTFAIENQGPGAISVRIQLSSNNINWIDNKPPYTSDYILLEDDNIILTTTAYMSYARILITHAENFSIEDATVTIYKTIKV